jgi:flavodoxin
MKIAVRYYSRSGNTKKLADAIANATGTKAKTTDEILSEPVELLFLGGAIYAGGIDSHLKEFTKQLTSDKVKKVVVFNTAAGGKSIHPSIKELLNGKGITVVDEVFSCKAKFLLANRGRPNEQDCSDVANFAKNIIKT